MSFPHTFHYRILIRNIELIKKTVNTWPNFFPLIFNYEEGKNYIEHPIIQFILNFFRLIKASLVQSS